MIQSLDRGLQVLDMLAKYESLGVTELAQMLDVDKSTASRIIDTLKEHDMVQQVRNTRKYKLGFRVLHLGEGLRKSLNVIDIARPILREVSRELEQSVHLCAYNNSMVYVIDQVVSHQQYTMLAMVGMIEPIHSSSVGKCILSYRRDDIIDMILEGYEYTQYTPKTISNKEDLLKELRKIKEQGYAVDDEEMLLGVRCVAAPVFDYRNSVRYSIGISGPTTVMTSENIAHYKKKLITAANRIGREMGYRVK